MRLSAPSCIACKKKNYRLQNRAQFVLVTTVQAVRRVEELRADAYTHHESHRCSPRRECPPWLFSRTELLLDAVLCALLVECSTGVLIFGWPVL